MRNQCGQQLNWALVQGYLYSLALFTICSPSEVQVTVEPGGSGSEESAGAGTASSW